MLTQTLRSRRHRRKMEESLVIETSVSSARPVPSLVLVFDLELGSTWKGLVVPSAKIVETCLRSSANAVTSLSVPTTMWHSRLNRATRRERFVGNLPHDPTSF